MQVRENMRQRLRQTAGFKDGVERAARTDNQQNVGDRAKAVLRMGQHCAHAHVLADPQQVVGKKHGDKHRGDRVADKLQQGIQRAFFCHVQLGNGFHQHQGNRQQHGEQRGAQRRQRVFFPHLQV
ncbi:Uncharacterised protein [Enterobacter kobei]|nr:Uncharacterised protein [Enterobacter kobei]